MPRKLLKGGNYSREETIRGNTVCVFLFWYVINRHKFCNKTALKTSSICDLLNITFCFIWRTYDTLYHIFIKAHFTSYNTHFLFQTCLHTIICFTTAIIKRTFDYRKPKINPWLLWSQNSIIKVHIFWEGHKILQNLHLTFDWHYLHRTEVRWRFCKILWPSQNIWTLNKV